MIGDVAEERGSVVATSHPAYDATVKKARMPDIAALERRLGQLLPESFREVVTSDAYPQLLAAFSNGDAPLSARELGTSRWRDPDHLPPRVLQFMVENQAAGQPTRQGS
jgi:hypothetical protein